jgi:hypothetical protein
LGASCRKILKKIATDLTAKLPSSATKVTIHEILLLSGHKAEVPLYNMVNVILKNAPLG